MQVNRCVSCMEKIEGYPCPHCGFAPGAQPQPDYALPWNTILHGKFLTGRVLGRGGFGITYMGWDLALEMKAAIKEYFPSGQVVRQSGGSGALNWSGSAQGETDRRTGMESFLKEARKMARVDRVPEVVRVRDAFYENDTAYIVMDFVEGETLKDRVKREGPLSFDAAMEVFHPVLTAMEQVHRAGLIHRDLSPDNIMLEPGGGVRILDLGAAKDLTVNRGASSMNVAKAGFSPLEQYGQRGGSGTWTDVYAMAATIYYTLTGLIPPNAADRVNRDELRWDLPALAVMPAPALTALQKAMFLMAGSRTRTMRELLAGLETREPGPPPRNVIASGKAGDSVAWTLDNAGVMTISGSGKMYDFCHNEEDRPWKNFQSKITAVVVKPGVTEIGGYTFQSCVNLAHVTLPKGLQIIWANAFESCGSLTSVTFPEGLRIIGAFAFESCGSLTSVTFPEGLQAIHACAFDSCGSLARVVLPQGLETIEASAFGDCGSLTGVTFPEGLQTIGPFAFGSCGGLTGVILPQGLETIGGCAFQDCGRLTSAVFPKGLKSIQKCAFSGCTSLLDVYYGGSETQWRDIEIGEGNEELLSANIHCGS